MEIARIMCKRTSFLSQRLLVVIESTIHFSMVKRESKYDNVYHF